VVKTTVTDVVGPTVTTDNPLRTLDDVLGQRTDGHTDVAGASVDQRGDLGFQFLGLGGILTVFQPFGEVTLQLVAAAVASQAFFHQAGQAVAHHFSGVVHT